MWTPNFSPKVAAIVFGVVAMLFAIRMYTRTDESESRGSSTATYFFGGLILAAVVAASVAIMRHQQGSTAATAVIPSANSVEGFKVALNDFRESTSKAFMDYYKPRMNDMKTL